MRRSRNHFFRSAAGVLAGGVIALAARTAAASPQDVFGYGPRSTAMAGAGASIGWGFETVRSNPALLSLSRERSLTAGWFGAFFDLEAGGHIPADAVSGTFIGGTLPLPFEGFLKDRLTLGLGFFTPFDLVARARLLYPERYKFPVVDRVQTVAVQMGLGVDLGHGVRIGGGFSALAALTGSVLVATDASGRVGTVVEDTLVAAYGPIVGASYERGPYRVGLTYRGELSGPFDVVINVRDLGSITVPPLHISGIAQYDPHQAELEVSRELGPFRVALGATYRHWSAYPGAVEPTVRCPPQLVSDDDEVIAKVDELRERTGLDLPRTGEPCDPSTPEPPRYSDTVTPRLAAEGRFGVANGVTIKARAGYAFEPSPAPEQTGRPNDFDNHRSVIGLGYGLSLSKPLPRIDLDLFGQVQIFHDRDHHKADGAVISTRGTAVALGATLGVNL